MDHSWGYGSDQRLREENQDCFGVFDFPDYTLAVICDGMGGHVGGAHASTLAVRTIHDLMHELQGRPVAQALEEAIQRTNIVIYEAARKNHRLMGMGTTVVAAVITRDTCYLAHVGDSRAYLVRRGGVEQLTRDHTMVNLFVDAELLSPEDAATHPEAHVLSRSLGVEPQVDVELSDPIGLESGDVVFLCSDGVHGIVTDWELGNIDWGAPHEGIREILRIVATREGDDNASGVAVMMGTSWQDVPATPAPEPKRFEDGVASASGMTAVPIDEEMDDNALRQDRPGGAGYVVYEDHPIVEPATENQKVVLAPDPVAKLVPTPTKTSPTPSEMKSQAPSKPAQAAKAKPKKTSRVWLLPLVGFGAITVATICGVGVLLAPPMGGTDLPVDVEDTDVRVELPIPSPEGPAQADPRPGGSPAPRDPTAPQPEPEAEVPAPIPPPTNGPRLPETQPPNKDWVFNPELPNAPRRMPARPANCTQPPPGGAEQYEAIDAARNKQCAVATTAVQRGMVKSIDHCKLYWSTWLCFNEAHQRPLEDMKAKTWDDFVLQVPHFDGSKELREQRAKLDPTLKNVPAIYQPAVDGIEARLEMWTADQGMQTAVADLFGEPTVADHLAKDLHLEALAAAGLAAVPPAERTRLLEETWARRVYVLSRALQGPAGAVIDTHRKDLMPLLRSLLAASMTDYVDERGYRTPIPSVVREAYEVGIGNRPVPSAFRPAAVRPEGLEPEIPDDDAEIEIRRTGRDR